jgi:hypothetical protein
MCCATCKVPVFTFVRKRALTPLWDSENCPKNDVPRDMYGRPLQKPALKPAAVKMSGAIGTQH